MAANNNFLYHSTFRTRLSSIKKLGLGAKQIKNWEFSQNNVVCLTSDPEVAFSFCETADEVADSVYESGIIVLAVNINDLDRRLIATDNNIVGDTVNGVYYFIYRGIIRPDKLYVVSRSKGLVGNLSTLKRVPSYE